MKILQDVWILEKSGIVIFHREFDKVVSPQLFGAMMSALNMFSEQLAEGGMSNFELENSRFTIIKQQELIFVANSSKKYKQKKVNKELRKLSDKFFRLYGEMITKFTGKIGSYSNFINEIKDFLEEKPSDSK
ncbi:MAG: hypothetical protein ACFFC3_15005 [Candidatus Odinarchaeota archaeon]